MFTKILFGLIIVFLPEALYGFETNVVQIHCDEIMTISENNYQQYPIYTDTIIETTIYYRNGNIKHKTTTFYDQQGIIYKVLEEKYRDNGSRKYVFVLDYGVTILYQARYEKSNQMIFEKYFTYNFKGTLFQIETKRNGNSSIKTFDVDIFGDTVYTE